MKKTQTMVNDMYDLVNSSVSYVWRVLFSLAMAALITATLFLVMLKLVDGKFEAPIEDPTHPMIDIWMGDERDPVEPRREIVKPDPQQEPPEIELDAGPADLQVMTTVPPAKLTVNDFKPKFQVASHSVPVAHLLRQPKYPSRALNRGIEGWVDLKFDITSQGVTENIVILAAEPEGYFESAAMKAVRSWKYQPFIGDSGEPRGYPGLTKRLVFEIQK